MRDSLQTATGQPRCFLEVWFQAFTCCLSLLMQKAETWFLDGFPRVRPCFGFGNIGPLPLKWPSCPACPGAWGAASHISTAPLKA